MPGTAAGPEQDTAGSVLGFVEAAAAVVPVQGIVVDPVLNAASAAGPARAALGLLSIRLFQRADSYRAHSKLPGLRLRLLHVTNFELVPELLLVEHAPLGTFIM